MLSGFELYSRWVPLNKEFCSRTGRLIVDFLALPCPGHNFLYLRYFRLIVRIGFY